MAKKKTGSRKAASRGTRKGARTARTGARAARPTGGAAPHISATLTRQGDKTVSKVTWNPGPAKINLTPLKAILDAHIARLSKASPSDDVTRTLNLLQETRNTLGSICGSTMVVPTQG